MCKSRRDYFREWVNKNKEKVKEYHKNYYQENKRAYLDREEKKKLDPVWRIARSKQRKESEKRSGKYWARRKYGDLIARKLTAENKRCQICGELKGTQFHHINYSKPLLGYHLCIRHHREAHKEPGILMNIKARDYDQNQDPVRPGHP